LLVAGWGPIDPLLQRLALPVPKKLDYQTAAGFVLDRLGRMPVAGDFFDEGGYRFEVVDLDGRRIDKILVSRLQTPTRRQLNVP
jgi:putative hemolysin